MCNKGIKKTRQIHVKGTIWLACSRWNGGGEDSVDRLLLPQEKISTFSIDIFPHSQIIKESFFKAMEYILFHRQSQLSAFPKQSMGWSIRSKLWKASAQCGMAVTCFETWYYFFSLTYLSPYIGLEHVNTFHHKSCRKSDGQFQMVNLEQVMKSQCPVWGGSDMFWNVILFFQPYESL